MADFRGEDNSRERYSRDNSRERDEPEQRG